MLKSIKVHAPGKPCHGYRISEENARDVFTWDELIPLKDIQSIPEEAARTTQKYRRHVLYLTRIRVARRSGRVVDVFRYCAEGAYAAQD
jgi:hypothetical protein